MGTHSDEGSAGGATSDAKTMVDDAILQLITDAERREADLNRREQELSILEKDLTEREKLVESKEKSFSKREQEPARDWRKVEHVNKLCKLVERKTCTLEVAKLQILRERQNQRKHMDEAFIKIKKETEQLREEVFNNMMQEVEAFRLPSASLCFRDETAEVNKLIAEIKKAGKDYLDAVGTNDFSLIPEAFR
ncbi:unnamed protein product [Orchesella dallaii]|uniref:Uncharacterized protein n=1 Tax=Orchesella dallaii TaxID=48710 RepID=A0ABP1PR16_9HEXA